jgi:hypothetical protein
MPGWSDRPAGARIGGGDGATGATAANEAMEATEAR